MKNLTILCLSFFCIILSLNARITDNKIHPTIKNEILSITVDPGFHLNVDAPAKLVDSISKLEITPTQKNHSEFIFSLTKVKGPKIILEYYVCDDQNTICEQHKENYNIKNNSLTLDESVPNANQKIALMNTLSAAKEKAVKEKKLLFVDFSAPWCPACLRLETEVFDKKYFKEYTKKFVTVSLNRDIDQNNEDYTKYKVTVIPTIIIMDAKGNELFRSIDFRQGSDLLNDISKNIKDYKKTKSYDEYLKLAHNDNKDAIRYLAMRAYNMFDYKEALSWFKKLNEQNIFSASAEINILEKENSKDLVTSYQKYIDRYPQTFDSLIWRIELAKIIKGENSLDADTKIDKLIRENISLIKQTINSTKLKKKIFSETAQGLFTTFETEELFLKLLESYRLINEKKEENATLFNLQNTISKHPLSSNRSGEVLVAIDYMKAASMTSDIEKWFLKLIEKNPATDLYPRKLARFYLKEKNYTKALPIALLAVKLSGRYLFLNYSLLAQIQKELNLKNESILTAKKALDLPEAKEAGNKESVELLKNIIL